MLAARAALAAEHNAPIGGAGIGACRKPTTGLAIYRQARFSLRRDRPTGLLESAWLRPALLETGAAASRATPARVADWQFGFLT
jgi:hypothetical protein